jgi:hypothetical protein
MSYAHTHTHTNTPERFPPVIENDSHFFVHPHFRIVLLFGDDVRVDDNTNENIDEQKVANNKPRPEEHAENDRIFTSSLHLIQKHGWKCAHC